MGRPPLKRTIARLPDATFFKPAGIRARELEQVGLGVDEVEALRLVDLEGLSQEQAAAELGVSRQTVGRMLDEAHRKVADALVNGKAVLIDGGAYALAAGRYCVDCGAYWSQGSTVVDEESGRESCPACGSPAVQACVGAGRGRGRRCTSSERRGRPRSAPGSAPEPSGRGRVAPAGDVRKETIGEATRGSDEKAREGGEASDSKTPTTEE